MVSWWSPKPLLGVRIPPGLQMKLIRKAITLKEIDILAKKRFGNLVKAVVDIEKRIMVIDGELHADEEALLLKKGSKQKDLWGINLYPELSGKDFVEFDSMVNIRPSAGNMSRGVTDPKIKKKILSIVNELVKK